MSDDEQGTIERLRKLSTDFMGAVCGASLPANWRKDGHNSPYEWAATADGQAQLAAHREISLYGVADPDKRGQAIIDGLGVKGAYLKIQSIPETGTSTKLFHFIRKLKGWADEGFDLLYEPGQTPSFASDEKLQQWAGSVPKDPASAMNEPPDTAAARLMALVGEYAVVINRANAPDDHPDNPRWQTARGQAELRRHRGRLRQEINGMCYIDIPHACDEMVNEAHISGLAAMGKQACQTAQGWAERGWALLYPIHRTPTILSVTTKMGEDGKPCDELTDGVEQFKRALLSPVLPILKGELETWEHEAAKIYEPLRRLAKAVRSPVVNDGPSKLSTVKAPAKTRRKVQRRQRTPTTKQIEALKVVGENNRNFAEAARQLGVHPKTVRQHFYAGLKNAGKLAPKFLGKSTAQQLASDRRGQANVSEDKRKRG